MTTAKVFNAPNPVKASRKAQGTESSRASATIEEARLGSSEKVLVVDP